MQIIYPVNGNDPAVNDSQVAADATYNIGTGTRILLNKWKIPYSIGDNDPYTVEDWYYAVWSYNSFTWINNPNNPRYSTTRGIPWNCYATPQDQSLYPYQELIWGCASHPHEINGTQLWERVDVTLPSVDLETQ